MGRACGRGRRGRADQRQRSETGDVPQPHREGLATPRAAAEART